VNTYETKKEARIDALHARADRLASEANAASEHARKLADIIPFGQPILVGHHSEGRDRRYRAKISRTMDKSVALYREAQAAAGAAHAAEKNTAISSDDPDAVEKLRAKCFDLKAERARMKATNVLLRKGGDVVAALATLGFSERTAKALQEPDDYGRIGFADYQFTNTGSEIRRLEKRIAALEARDAAPAKPAEQIGEVRIVEEENRVRVFFPGKPSGELRSLLKRNGFRWSPTVGAWQAFISARAWDVARTAAAQSFCGHRPCAPSS